MEMQNGKVRIMIFRGERGEGDFKEYEIPYQEGMVVLDAVLYVQSKIDGDISVRWNCKAAKCGSCAAEINGKPSLMCKTKVAELKQPIKVEPLKAYPHIKDLVADTSWNLKTRRKIIKDVGFTPKKNASWLMKDEEIEKGREMRKCIECALCLDTCHVLREHKLFDKFVGPAYLVFTAYLESHPMDSLDRISYLKEQEGIMYCNITKCCTEVCPEEIHITDNAIIPLKESVADQYFDPIKMLLRKIKQVGK
jgi:succinate dehydrogenase / fumarate reductase iron-sulfur subunit